jgi:hypothetical protein
MEIIKKNDINLELKAENETMLILTLKDKDGRSLTVTLGKEDFLILASSMQDTFCDFMYSFDF